MKLTTPFLKLPISFSVDKLQADVAALPPEAWLPHPQAFEGNEAVPLVSPGGEMTDAFDGPMAPTEHLLASPYLMEVMRELGATWGRSRLMALAPGADVPPHVDIHYYWRTHYRVHVPIITNPGVEFTCAEDKVHMQAGECWIPDTFRRHTVQNNGDARRIHLVMDTVGGERFWELMSAALDGLEVRHEAPKASDLQFEQVNSNPVMPPYELQYHLQNLCSHVVPFPQMPLLEKRLDRFVAAWFAAWARFGASEEGFPTYGELIARVQRDISLMCGKHVQLDNGKTFLFFFERFLLASALSKKVIAGLMAEAQPSLRHTAAR